MRGVRFLLPAAWLLMLGAVFLAPEKSGPWLLALVLPMAGAAFFLPPRLLWLLAAASSLSSLYLIRVEPLREWLPAAWVAYAMVPFFLWRKARRTEGALAACAKRQRQLSESRELLLGKKRKWTSTARGQEEGISTIVELYGISKRFLATLDLEEAIRIAEEVLKAEGAHLAPSRRQECLSVLREDLEKGRLSLEALSSLPGPAEPPGAERFDILKGQLAMGLRRVGLYQRVQESATHDSLTGLWVRRHFLERLAEEIDRSSRRELKLAFLMVDLDFFKRVNDTYGHLVGDVVLKEAALRLRRSVREIDLVARYGGEEFALALPEANRLLGVQVAERIRQTMSQTNVRAYDELIGMTVSVGVAIFPDDARTVEDLIEAADQAMYRAKALGRNRTVAGAPLL